MLVFRGVYLLSIFGSRHSIPSFLKTYFHSLVTLQVGTALPPLLGGSVEHDPFVWNKKLGGGFKHFFFHPYLGKISSLTNIFQMG